MILKLVWKDKIDVKNIAVLTPYRQQEDKIKEKIRTYIKYNKTNDYILPENTLEELKIGTVEKLQGQERDVILVSIVRSNEKYLKHDKKFQLGFLENIKGMNVSISRAKEALCIVGNMNILKKQKHWNELLDIIKSNDYKNSIIDYKDYKYEHIEIVKDDYNRIHGDNSNVIKDLKEN